MVGDIQEPLRLSYQGDYFHSGSISFGRYETEALCNWERRSSFSHNRYLEEVERCSKPGSVTEKKAYFEAHFKKKALLSNNALECQSGSDSQNGREDENTQNMSNEDIKIEHHNEEIHRTNYDQSHMTEYGSGCSGSPETDYEHSFDTLYMVEKMVHKEVLIEARESGCEDGRGNSTSILCEPESEMKEILTGCGEAATSKKSSKFHRIHANCEKDSTTKVKTWSAATMMSSVSGTLKTLVSRIPKAKIHENKSFLLQKESTAKSNVTLRRSTSERDGPRPQQMANRHMKSVNSTQPNLKQNGFISDQRAERRKELEEKILSKETKAQQVKAKKQEKTEADMKQLRKSLSFKATPMPSFYTEARRSVDRSKVVAANLKTSKPQNKPPNASPGAGTFKRSLSCQTMRSHEACFMRSGSRKNDSKQVSGETSHTGSVSSDNKRNADSNGAAAERALISKAGHKEVISKSVVSQRALESKPVSKGRKMEDATRRNGILRTRTGSLAVGVA